MSSRSATFAVFFYTGTEVTKNVEVACQTDGAICSSSQLQKLEAHVRCLERRLQRYQLKLARVTAQERRTFVMRANDFFKTFNIHTRYVLCMCIRANVCTK